MKADVESVAKQQRRRRRKKGWADLEGLGLRARLRLLALLRSDEPIDRHHRDLLLYDLERLWHPDHADHEAYYRHIEAEAKKSDLEETTAKIEQQGVGEHIARERAYEEVAARWATTAATRSARHSSRAA
jgi:hypothetical protein